MKTILIDLDGTMYKGNDEIVGAKEYVSYLQKKNIPYLFLTNNATRTKKQNKEHMEKLGFTGIKEDDFFTSSMASALYIKKISDKRKVFVIGQDGLKEALLQQGFEIVEDNADFVVVGLDFYADYEKYSKALQQLVNGAVLVATNNDRKLPSGNTFKIGNGSVVAMLEYAMDVESIKVGKPFKPILDEVLNFLNLEKEDVLLVGDNLETDIRLGYDNDVETIFVMTGVHREEDIERTQIYPTKTISSLLELIDKE